MKIVISPAKSLDYTTAVPTTKSSLPVFNKEISEVNEVLKTKTPNELMELMKISQALGDLNWKRNQERELLNNAACKQAVYAFNGDVYTGLDAYTIEENKLPILEDKLRILSGLYGLLKPFDLIEPYRLEMGTKLPIGDKANLYEFWKPTITQALNSEMTEGEILVNLASTEYFSAIDKKSLKGEIVTPDFKDYKNGKLKVISFFAKKARGMMVRYIVDNNINDVEGIKGFTMGGYAYSEDLSTRNNLVFTR